MVSGGVYVFCHIFIYHSIVGTLTGSNMTDSGGAGCEV